MHSSRYASDLVILSTLKGLSQSGSSFLGTWPADYAFLRTKLHTWNCLPLTLLLPSLNSSVIVLSYLLFIYGRSHFGVSYGFFYYVEIGFKVLQVLLLIEGLHSWLRILTSTRIITLILKASMKGVSLIGFRLIMQQDQNILGCCLPILP